MVGGDVDDVVAPGARNAGLEQVVENSGRK
jgi:hypothetical protein